MRDDQQRVKVAVLTISDTRDDETDTSGRYLATAAGEAGHEVVGKRIVGDEVEGIRAAIREFIADGAEVILTTGGTGLTGRDVTPEAVQPMFDKVIDGFAPVWHRVSFDSIGLSTLQSRACAGLVGTTLLFCLPGSSGAVRDGWTKVIAPQLDRSTRPCNFVEIMPRFAER